MVLFLVAQAAGVTASSPVASNVPGFQPASSSVLPTWQQVDSNGFGNPLALEVSALETFGAYLYAGTYKPVDPLTLIDGARIYRSSDGATWNAVTQPGFGISHDIAPSAILDFVVFNNYLYAGTGRRNASQIWRSQNGTIWSPMDVTGFADEDNIDISAFAVYNGKIYAGIKNRVNGVQIWSSFTGDNNSWVQVAPDVPGTVVSSVTGFAEFSFDGGLYAAVETESAPAQIWRSYGADWEIAVNNGFGDSNTTFTGGMAEFGGYLYVGAGNISTGAQLWRTNDGETWGQVIAPAGLGDLNNRKVESVTVFQNSLYITLNNIHTGIEVWRSANGTSWERVNQDGFGDSDNTGSNWSNASAGFKCQLYVGTANDLDGGELWRQQKLYDVALSADQAKQGSAGSQVSYTLSITNTGIMTDNFTLSATGQSWVTNLAPALVNLPLSASANINVTVTIPPGAPNQAVDTATITAASQTASCQTDTATVTTTATTSVTPSISLSNTTVNENQPVNTVVGILSMTNPDPGATYTYSLTCAAPGADDASFNINGTNLRASAIFNFEAKSPYNICIRATDQLALTFDKNFVISVNNVNEPPTNITLSANTVNENQPINTVVGALSATDPDAGATFTFSLTCAIPGADDASFNVSGTNLRTSAFFDYETKSTYNICLRATDQGGLTFDKNFVISVNNLPEGLISIYLPMIYR